MTVTELVEVSASRVKVYIDEQFAFVLYKGELRKYRLQEGSDIEPDVYKELVSVVLPKRAKLRCMNLLKTREYTREQLRLKLKRGFYPDEIIEEALAYVASYHYIDDLRYAEDFINCSHTYKSRRRIENDLRGKGVSQETIVKAWERWEKAGNEQDEEEQIRALLLKKHFDAGTANRREIQRIYAFLARRGFDTDKIRRLLLQ